jgi:BSD domain
LKSIIIIMWKSLRSDLTEFVSTVAGDTTEALNRMDENFPDAETEILNDSNGDDDVDKSGDNEDDDNDLAAEMEECVRRMKIKETFTTPLLLLPDNDDKEQKPAADGATEMDGKEASEKESASGVDKAEDGTADKEEDGVEDDDNDDEGDANNKAEENEIRAFLDSFSLDAKTDEIAALLEAHPDTLKVSFEELVPTGEVTYQEFWQRYFYRCDPERIAAEWAAEDERVATEASKNRTNHAVALGFTAVTNFLGGAVKAVSSSLAEDDAGVSNPNAAKRRPPFVMSADSGDEDEEEVELGWDDDDDDEDDEGTGKQNTIEFNDAATEKLQEQLKTALEERDLLHQTVEMQTKEICALKAATTIEGNTTITSGGSSSSSSSGHDDEVKKLKTELFEKDSELAALRASLLDTSGVANIESPHHAALELEVKRLSVQLNESEERAKEAVSFLKSVKQELEKSALQTKQIEEELARVVEEKSKLEASLQSQKSAAQAKLQQSGARADRLEKELQEAQEQLSSVMQQQQQHAATATVESESSVDSPATQDTVTSAIKVEAPGVVGVGEKGSNEEGWDDDW